VIRLTVLGSCGTYPTVGRACSGYLLEAGDGERPRRVWIDTGSGTLTNLLRHATLPQLDAIWISHLHVDHLSDMPVAYYTLRYGDYDPPPAPVPVYGPAGWSERVADFMAVDRTAIEEAFQVHELHDRERVDLGPLQLTAIATVHSVETYAVRASDGESILAYSADSGPCDALLELADGADLFVCEATWTSWPDDDRPIHLTAELAGEFAGRAGAHRLALTHLRPGADTAAAVARAGRSCDCAVEVAIEGASYELQGAVR
jgi:ribonuclease BN (tRNA processing enzyme)